MLERVKNLANRVKQLNINDALDYAVLVPDVNRYARYLNTDVQLYAKGVLPSGKATGKYAASTISRKKAQGKKYSHVTLKDTGVMYRGWTANSKNGILRLKAPVHLTDEKGGSLRNKLLLKYGDFEGLTIDSKKKFSVYIRAYLAEYARKKIKTP